MDDRKRRKPIGGRAKRRGVEAPKGDLLVRSEREPWEVARPPSTDPAARSAAPPKRKIARLNFDWLTERLAIGGSFERQAVEVLAGAHHFSRVVDLRGDDCDDELHLGRHGIRLLHLPTEECCAIAPEVLARGVAWARSALRAHNRVLIHCQHGIGRSALLAMCVLVDGGLSPLAAMTLAKDARALVAPSPDQLQAFLAFAAEHAAGKPWTMPSFDELAAIAYRHLAWKAGELGSGTAGG
jgi:protein-tyrosine phosphatase